MSLLSTLNRSAALGLGTGIRSTTPLALVAQAAARGTLDVPDILPFKILRDSRVAAAFAAAAVGEAIADATLPLPPRPWPPSLLGRMAIGATLGALVCAEDDQPVAAGAGVGALAAAWSSFAATGGRKLLTDSGVPDLAASLLEDAQAMLLGAAVLGRRRSTVG